MRDQGRGPTAATPDQEEEEEEEEEDKEEALAQEATPEDVLGKEEAIVEAVHAALTPDRPQ